jgi:DNA-binding SARP family transcriptional activator
LLALSLRHLGDAAFHRQDYPAALVHYQESTLLYHESDDAWSFALGLENLAETLCRSSYEEKAALLFGAAQAQRARTLESALLPYHSHSEQSASLQQRLGRELFARRWAQGRKMTPREIALEVQALPSSVVHPAGAAAALVQEHECENTLPGDRRPASDSSRITLVQERGRVPLRLLALGPTQVYRGEHLLEAADWAFTKPRALLFYLLCYAPCAKSEVGLALWPEASQAQLRSCFHSALYHLRRVLGSADWIHFENQRYVFQRTAASCWFDVEVFEAHLVSAQQAWQQQPEAALEHYRQAIALYRGDFLQDCDEEAWLVSRRQTLRQGYLNALLTIGRCLFTQQQYAQAAEAYRQIIASEPFHEEAHRELMRCAARMGDRPQAVRHFQQLHARLSDELGVAPASETLALLARLRRGERI